MKFEVGDFLLESGYVSGNKYIWKVIRVYENEYKLKMIHKIIVKQKSALGDEWKTIKININNYGYKKISKEEAVLEML